MRRVPRSRDPDRLRTSMSQKGVGLDDSACLRYAAVASQSAVFFYLIGFMIGGPMVFSLMAIGALFARILGSSNQCYRSRMHLLLDPRAYREALHSVSLSSQDD
jgi:hypothetical protein